LTAVAPQAAALRFISTCLPTPRVLSDSVLGHGVLGIFAIPGVHTQLLNLTALLVAVGAVVMTGSLLGGFDRESITKRCASPSGPAL